MSNADTVSEIKNNDSTADSDINDNINDYVSGPTEEHFHEITSKTSIAQFLLTAHMKIQMIH